MNTQTYGIDKHYSIQSYNAQNLNHFDFSGVGSLIRAHEKKENNWTKPYLARAYNDYRYNRENGEAQDNPSSELTYDGKVEWEETEDGFYRVKYTEGPNDKLWMEEKDLNYLTRLAREGNLMWSEPTWKNVLAKWTPESKRTAAIANVEFEINASTKTEPNKRKAEMEEPPDYFSAMSIPTSTS